MKMQLLDARKEPSDPDRVLAELILDKEGHVAIEILSESARSMLEHGLVEGVPMRSEGDRFVTPSEGEKFLDAVEERWGRSTYFRTKRIAVD